MRKPSSDFFARQFFLICALMISFCLAHTLMAGSLFSSTSRAEFEKSRAELNARKEAALKRPATGRWPL
ncbi:MAG: hypothetical protein KF767_13090 [Bdellovibrionaceae bacterium]|nr:hypothetical protein [Pseudobdellovibrionaceae bacterium]